jgi:hypothetical protein
MERHPRLAFGALSLECMFLLNAQATTGHNWSELHMRKTNRPMNHWRHDGPNSQFSYVVLSTINYDMKKVEYIMQVYTTEPFSGYVFPENSDMSATLKFYP